MASPNTHISSGPYSARTAVRPGLTMISPPVAFRMLGPGFLGGTCSRPIRGDWPDTNWKGWWERIHRITLSSLHLDPSCSSPHRDGRRHDVPLHNRRLARRSTVHARPLPEWTCGLAVGRTQSSSIFVRASLMNCTLLSRRSCSAGGNRCSKGLTCGSGIRMR